MNVLMVEPGKAPYETQIGDDLQSMQALVGGYIQAVYPFEQPVALVCRESGKLDGRRSTVRCAMRTVISTTSSREISLSSDSAKMISPTCRTNSAEQFAEQFRQPELFLREGDKIVAAPMPDEQAQGGMSY